MAKEEEEEQPSRHITSLPFLFLFILFYSSTTAPKLEASFQKKAKRGSGAALSPLSGEPIPLPAACIRVFTRVCLCVCVDVGWGGGEEERSSTHVSKRIFFSATTSPVTLFLAL